MDSKQRTVREDKRGRYLDSEGIGAGAEGNQLITWGGDVDQIEVRPSPHGGKVFMALGMLGLDPYKSPETCPQVRFTLTDKHARQLADGIYAALADESERDADARVVDAMIMASVRGDSGGMALAFDNLRKRFIGRIAELDAREAKTSAATETAASS
jgi:hypothetical protein